MSRDPQQINRRTWLQHAGHLAGSVAVCSLASQESVTAAPAKTDRGPHFEPTARSVIFLFMSGGPSQVDSWDPKPQLADLHGKDVPDSLARNVPRIKRAGLHNLMASPFKFQQHGESGIPVSELFPATAGCVDDLCVIRSLHHRNPVHGPGECVALTGTGLGDRPSFGAWTVFGLGSENQNLPSFITMNLNTSGMQYPQAAGWGAGFLPASHQGVVVDAKRGVQDIAMPQDVTVGERRRQLELIDWFNAQHLHRLPEDSELEARMRSYQMAFRMQTAAPELFGLEGESDVTTAMYGLGNATTHSMGHACLLARRMVERGVRFVQIRFGGWDAHSGLVANHTKMASMTDGPIAALLNDLKQRDLLSQTLVVWFGEFGRTPTMEGRGKGRDHNPAGYTVWLAGGGVRGGQVIGATDDIGYVPVERPVRPSDLHATLLHALGLDQHRLAFPHNGRDEIATVLGGDVVREVFA